MRYFREHVNQLRRAMADGVDVRGSLPWTLIDNCEWAEGYAANFGLTNLEGEEYPHYRPDGGGCATSSRRISLEACGGFEHRK